ncbi:hypothetical protein [Novosphingobium sp. ST904]|nr:hypothetical protein [Novosphingobium sp. ST904]TCM29067.1 hypothetical protein EDF59_1281 [Novosphingobium sp. ST904]
MGQFSMVIYTPPGSHLSGNQHREISLSFGTLLIVLVVGYVVVGIRDCLDRLADTADIEMCLEAVRVGIDPGTLPATCKALRTQAEGEPV